MNIKISELNLAQELTGEEVLPIVQNGNTVKTPISSIKSEQPYRSFVANVYKSPSNLDVNSNTYENNNTYPTLKKGDTYHIDSYSSGDDFSNLAQVISGNINEPYCVFKVTGDSRYYRSLEKHISPNVWENGSTLFTKGKLINDVIYNDFEYDLEWSFNYDSDIGSTGMSLSFPEDIDPSKIQVKFTTSNLHDSYSSPDQSTSVSYFSTNGARLQMSNLDFNWGKTFDGTTGVVYAIEKQNDGKILVGGEFNSYYKFQSLESYNLGIFRLNPDGSTDETFMVDNVDNGEVGFYGTSLKVNTIKIQDDGKILVGGNFLSLIDGTYDNNNNIEYEIFSIARLNSDGTRDETFLSNESNGFTFDIYPSYLGGVTGIDVDSDGKILVSGLFNEYKYDNQTYTIYSIMRLNSDGSPDLDFLNNVSGFTNITYNDLSKIISLDSGKILVSGTFNEYVDINGTHSVSSLIRLNNDGTLDETFNNTGFTTNFFGTANVQDIKIQDDGKIVVGGFFQGYQDSQGTYEYVKNLIRLTEDGEFDNTFYHDTGEGEGVDSSVYCLELAPNGKILVGGSFETFGILNANGVFNYNYGKMVVLDENGLPICDEYSGVDSEVYSIKYIGDKKFFAGGYFYTDTTGNLYPFYNGGNFWRFNLENDVNIVLNFEYYLTEFLAESFNTHLEIKVYN
jgi:uncharacterized delta-60 repeat protein